ncbi:MAG TPA: hypothetical protein VHN20_19260 [Beijerinckiaceae bacterium]|nr:hypothetical protein [Beijerinckiaceae bacterium]
MAGLPGTGLGGVFYALLIMWMAMREAWLALRGSSSAARWGKIGRFGALLGAIVAALWGEGWLLQQIFGPAAGILGTAEPGSARALAVGALAPALAWAPFVVLAALIVAMHVARLLLPLRVHAPTEDSSDAPAVREAA